MKIDGITLLTMIRDKKIDEDTLIEVSNGIHCHLPYVIFREKLYWAYAKNNIQGLVSSNDLLEYTFEIIEEKPKKITSLDLSNFSDEYEEKICLKIEELIQTVNYLLEKSDKE